MNWLIDLGNTRLKYAVLNADGSHGEVQAFAHADPESLAQLIAQLGPAEEGDAVWLASVASLSITETLTTALATQGYRLHRVRTAATLGRLRIAYDEPARLGVDRFLAMLAASERSDGPWLLVSVGSALTVDCLDADGRHLGGLIAPTPEHIREAMAERFPVMAVPTGQVLDFATDTADAVASGASAAALGLVERSLRLAQQHLGRAPTLLISGGAADVLAELAHAPTIVLSSLVLEGLARFAQAREN
ncbi:MAG TPA: type III pantothenate kinase [Arenimonas sp.]|uniref:type III pantothenate kinase n=1 Tax=Arenimonas sp. TaxID=1872635 RepID=UPI002BF6227B|nr:type III pantothenate kinase [Arenimonas sp.]HMB58198.1 type III pantothenate kinase [Arenimonas sp.]